MNAPFDDGGPAYPGEAGENGCGNEKPVFGPDGERRWIGLNQGMTLRDWFAGQALAWMMGNADMIGSFGHGGAMNTEAYQIADAMIAARNPKEAP